MRSYVYIIILVLLIILAVSIPAAAANPIIKNDNIFNKEEVVSGNSLPFIKSIFENPAFLTEIKNKALLYTLYTDSKYSFIYGEYDSYAVGYGLIKLAVNQHIFSGAKSMSEISYLAAKKAGNFSLGSSIYTIKKVNRRWFVDTGINYKYNPLSFNLSFLALDVTDFNIPEITRGVAGISFNFTDKIQAGIKYYYQENEKYKFHLKTNFPSMLVTEFYTVYGDNVWDKVGLDISFLKDIFLIQGSYEIKENNNVNGEIGLGIVF